MSNSKDFAMDCACECDKTCLCLTFCAFGQLDEVYERKIEPAHGKDNSRSLVKILSFFSMNNTPWAIMVFVAAFGIFGMEEVQQRSPFTGEILKVNQLTMPGQQFVNVVAFISLVLSWTWFHLFIKDVFPNRNAWSMCCAGMGCPCTVLPPCFPCAVTKVVKHAEKNLSRVGAPVHAQGYPYNSKAYGSV